MHISIYSIHKDVIYVYTFAYLQASLPASACLTAAIIELMGAHFRWCRLGSAPYSTPRECTLCIYIYIYQYVCMCMYVYVWTHKFIYKIPYVFLYMFTSVCK